MASVGARAHMGVWGLCPQWGPGALPLVRGQGALPPEAEAYITIDGLNFCLKITGYPGLSEVGKNRSPCPYGGCAYTISSGSVWSEAPVANPFL
jgi:hypothetical protein